MNVWGALSSPSRVVAVLIAVGDWIVRSLLNKAVHELSVRFENRLLDEARHHHVALHLTLLP
jgi:hypothetical protein